MTTSAVSRRSIMTGIRDFFFAEETPYGLALTRMFLPAIALIPMIRRLPRVRELFSSDGAPQQLFELFGEGRPLPELPPVFAMALYGVMIFALLSAVFGFRTRMALMIGTPLYIYFNLLDCVSTMTKYSVIASHILLILTVSNCGAVWSVDAILRRWKDGESASIPPKFPVWPARLVQLLFCFVYFGAAITKIQTAAFFSGEQMRYWMFSNWNYPNPVGELMAMWTPLLLASGYITVVWEITFPFLAWRPLGRFVALGIGILFHFMTFVTLGLYVFPMLCTTSYTSFLMEKDIVAIRNAIRRWRIPAMSIGAPRFAIARLIHARPAAIPLSMVWAAMALFAAVAANEIDRFADPYGMHANNGPMPLKPIPRDAALAMINSTAPLREKDKFFSFDIGSMFLGGQLANRSSEFEFGDVIVAQCNINPPHEDMWLECVIEDDANRVIDASGQFVTRDKLYANFSYATGNKLIPGKYWMVLKSSGKEVSRRPFTLTGDPESLPTMGELMTN